MKSSSSAYFPRLDHLRFLAVVMVLMWHSIHHGTKVPFTTVPSFFPLSLLEEGHTGVALFLTLSGFLFAALTEGKDVDYAGFFRNRLLRIAPLFIVWTLITFYTTQIPPERMLAVVFGLLDRQIYGGVGWTVLVEMQLYLIFPFLLTFSRRYGLRYLLGVILICGLLRLMVWLQYSGTLLLAYWTVFGRADQFILGMISFVAYRRFARVLGQPLFLIFAFLGLSYLYHQFNRQGGYYGSGTFFLWVYMPTLEGLAYGTLIASYLALRVRVPALIDRPLAWLGTISYSMYLSHTTVVPACYALAKRFFSYEPQTMSQFTLFTLLAVLPALVAVSALTYYVVEFPFLKVRKPYLRPREAMVDENAAKSEVVAKAPAPVARGQ
jgi:peptidoglycan/LPS O-acetylase OafA/YrhL